MRSTPFATHKASFNVSTNQFKDELKHAFWQTEVTSSSLFDEETEQEKEREEEEAREWRDKKRKRRRQRKKMKQNKC